MEKSTGSFNIQLQSARGLAALIVAIHHCTIYYTLSPTADFWLYTLFNGHASVLFFFVLSGYVLGASMMTKALTPKFILVFYTKRIFRIYPAIFVCVTIGLIYVSMVHFHVDDPRQSVWYNQFYKPEYFTISASLVTYLGIGIYLNPPIWSIFVELCASVIMPFLVMAIRNSVYLFAGLLVFFCGLAFNYGVTSRVGVLSYIPSFLMGVGIAYVMVRHQGLAARLRTPLYVLTLPSLAVLYLAHVVLPKLAYHDPLVANVEAIGALGVVASLALNADRFDWLRSATLRRLGDISYSLYLVHFPVMGFMGAALFWLSPQLSPMASMVALAMLTVPVAILLSDLLFRSVEMPGVQAGQRFQQVFFPRDARSR